MNQIGLNQFHNYKAHLFKKKLDNQIDLGFINITIKYTRKKP